MQDLIITIIQSDLIWEDIDSNIKNFDSKIDSIKGNTDLIVLPEMFPTGFTMNAESCRQDMEGPAVKWLKEKSKDTGVDITGSLIIKSENNYFNRLIWVQPDGGLFFYDKKHLFCYAGENKYYSPGNKKITVRLKGWKLRPFICYDLRFPLWTRNLNNEYDAAVFVANWPGSRSFHWKSLLISKAIENQCYVIGVNRVGVDGNKIEYSGDSAVINFKGDTLFEKANEEFIYTVQLSYAELKKYREEFPFWKDADFDLMRE